MRFIPLKDESGKYKDTQTGQVGYITRGKGGGWYLADTPNRTSLGEFKKENKYSNTVNKMIKEEPFSRKQVKTSQKYLGKYGIKGINSYNEDEKNKINPTANIEGGANTRVKRNWNRYSEEQRREEREKVLRQKIQDYKNKKNDWENTNKIYESALEKARPDIQEYLKDKKGFVNDEEYIKELAIETNTHIETARAVFNEEKNKIENRNINMSKQEEYLEYMRRNPNANTDIDTYTKNYDWYKKQDYKNKKDKLNKGDAFQNEMGTVVEIKDIDEKGQVMHSFQTSPTTPPSYRTFMEKDVKKMLDDNGYKKLNGRTSKSDEEYKLYKRAKINPDSIDPMTENSTDWEALDRKYASKYNQEIANKEEYDTTKTNDDKIKELARKNIENYKIKELAEKTIERFKERKGIDYTKSTSLKLKQLYETSFGEDKRQIVAELNVRGYYRKGNRWARK